MRKSLILGIAGGSGSGKTFLARSIQQALGEENCSLIYQDNYYIDQSSKFDFDGGSVNFDHPDALDFELLGGHLELLKNGQSIEIPKYDFKTHKRLNDTIKQKPQPVIILDGILILHSSHSLARIDKSIFVDTSEDVRYARRLKRDVEERGRTEDGVRSQFLAQVKPMHDQFVEPSKENADFCLDESLCYERAKAEIITLLRKYCENFAIPPLDFSRCYQYKSLNV